MPARGALGHCGLATRIDLSLTTVLLLVTS